MKKTIAMMMATALAAQAAQGATMTWLQGGDTEVWDICDGDNWGGVAPGPEDTATFGLSMTNALIATGDFDVTNITFSVRQKVTLDADGNTVTPYNMTLGNGADILFANGALGVTNRIDFNGNASLTVANATLRNGGGASSPGIFLQNSGTGNTLSLMAGASATFAILDMGNFQTLEVTGGATVTNTTRIRSGSGSLILVHGDDSTVNTFNELRAASGVNAMMVISNNATVYANSLEMHGPGANGANGNGFHVLRVVEGGKLYTSVALFTVPSGSGGGIGSDDNGIILSGPNSLIKVSSDTVVGGFSSRNYFRVEDGARFEMSGGTLSVGGVGGSNYSAQDAGGNKLTVDGASAFVTTAVLGGGCGRATGSQPAVGLWAESCSVSNTIRVLNEGMLVAGSGITVGGTGGAGLHLTNMPFVAGNAFIVESGGIVTNLGALAIGGMGDENRLVLENGTFILPSGGINMRVGNIATNSAVAGPHNPVVASSNNVVVVKGTNSLLRVGGAWNCGNGGGVDFTIGKGGYVSAPVVLAGDMEAVATKLVVNAAEWARKTGGEAELITMTHATHSAKLDAFLPGGGAEVALGEGYWLDVREDGGGVRTLVAKASPAGGTVILVR